MRAICIIDTSVFCEILDVPKMASQRDAIREALKARIVAREELLLPITTIIETGNHIGQQGDGNLRRMTAERFVEQVTKALGGETPFTPTPFMNDRELMQLLKEFPDWAKRHRGLGDLTIRGVWDEQCALYPRRRVYIWSLDKDLAGYDRRP